MSCWISDKQEAFGYLAGDDVGLREIGRVFEALVAKPEDVEESPVSAVGPQTADND